MFKAVSPSSPRAAAHSARRSLHLKLLAAALALGGAMPAAQAQDFYMGQLVPVGFNFCPRGMEIADGHLVPIAQNSALFSLLGTAYGGDGIRTFGVPDLRGRTPVGVGMGPGLNPIAQGEMAGTEAVTILQSNMPAHSHTLLASNKPATDATPAGDTVLAQTMNAGGYIAAASNTNVAMTGAIGASGGSGGIPIRDPFVGVLWCIVSVGIYPPRP